MFSFALVSKREIIYICLVVLLNLSNHSTSCCNFLLLHLSLVCFISYPPPAKKNVSVQQNIPKNGTSLFTCGFLWYMFTHNLYCLLPPVKSIQSNILFYFLSLDFVKWVGLITFPRLVHKTSLRADRIMTQISKRKNILFQFKGMIIFQGIVIYCYTFHSLFLFYLESLILI